MGDAHVALVLSAVEPGLRDAWNKFCGDLPGVTVHEGSILDVECDAVVSPANSFGFMDGGIDALYMDAFGPGIQTRVRQQIWDHHGGELVVGDADVVETQHHAIPYLIVAPTMRVPMRLADTVNPYLAARAVLRLVLDGAFRGGAHDGEAVRERVQRVATPGLGTGVGGVSFATCAKQVHAAYTDVVLGGYKMPQSWAEASERHQLLYTNRPKRLQ